MTLLHGRIFGLIGLLKYTMFPPSTSWLLCSAALPHAIRQGTVLLVSCSSAAVHVPGGASG